MAARTKGEQKARAIFAQICELINSQNAASCKAARGRAEEGTSVPGGVLVVCSRATPLLFSLVAPGDSPAVLCWCTKHQRKRGGPELAFPIRDLAGAGTCAPWHDPAWSWQKHSASPWATLSISRCKTEKLCADKVLLQALPRGLALLLAVRREQNREFSWKGISKTT